MSPKPQFPCCTARAQRLYARKGNGSRRRKEMLENRTVMGEGRSVEQSLEVATSPNDRDLHHHVTIGRLYEKW